MLCKYVIGLINKVNINKKSCANFYPRPQSKKWSEINGVLGTCRLNWARRTSWGWWDEWDLWGLARYLSVTEISHNIESLRVSGQIKFCFFKTWMPEQGSKPRSPNFRADSFNHSTRAPSPTHEVGRGIVIKHVWPSDPVISCISCDQLYFLWSAVFLVIRCISCDQTTKHSTKLTCVVAIHGKAPIYIERMWISENRRYMNVM